MAIDATHSDIVWNILYHIYLDEASCGALPQTREYSGDWVGSAYGMVVRFWSTITTSEVHRLLFLCADWVSNPSSESLSASLSLIVYEARTLAFTRLYTV